MRDELRYLMATAVAAGALLCPATAAADPLGDAFRVAEGLPYEGAAAWGDDRGVWVGQPELSRAGMAARFTGTAPIGAVPLQRGRG